MNCVVDINQGQQTYIQYRSIPGLPLGVKTETKLDNVKAYRLNFIPYNKTLEESKQNKMLQKKLRVGPRCMM